MPNDHSTGPLRHVTAHVPTRILRLAFGFAVLLTLVVGVFSAWSPLLKTFEHAAADWRTAFSTYRLPSQHERIAIITIDDDTLREAQTGEPVHYRSPIDRGLLARLVETLDKAKVRAIGIDIIFDQETEERKDKALIEAIRTANADIVLAALEFGPGRALAKEWQRQYHEKFLADASRSLGLITAQTEFDGVMRSHPQPSPASRITLSFAEAVAKSGGAAPLYASRRIAWLRPPADGSETFLRLEAEHLVSPRSQLPAILRNQIDRLEGRLVLIGAAFPDQADRHITPLAKRSDDLMPGVVVNAHIVAQLLDKRGYRELPSWGELAVVGLLGFAGTLAGWFFNRSGWLVGLAPLVLFVAIDWSMFAGFRLILPFAAPALAWLAGVYIGRAIYWRDKLKVRLRKGEASI